MPKGKNKKKEGGDKPLLNQDTQGLPLSAFTAIVSPFSLRIISSARVEGQTTSVLPNCQAADAAMPLQRKIVPSCCGGRPSTSVGWDTLIGIPLIEDTVLVSSITRHTVPHGLMARVSSPTITLIVCRVKLMILVAITTYFLSQNTM